jgi:hypothetical protein
MYSSDFERVARAAGARGPLGDDAVSRIEPQDLEFETAVHLAGLSDHDRTLRNMMDAEEVIDWTRFDITRFAPLMPSMATLDRIGPHEDADFVYRFVGESINSVAKRNLRGLRLSEILTGEGRDHILRTYRRTAAEARRHAGAGTVEVSDLTWVRYLRFLYPVRVGETVDRVLLIMLFSKD